MQSRDLELHVGAIRGIVDEPGQLGGGLSTSKYAVDDHRTSVQMLW